MPWYCWLLTYFAVACFLFAGFVDIGKKELARRRETMRIKQHKAEIAALPPAVDYKFIEMMENELATVSVEIVRRRAARAAEAYMTVDRNKLYAQHPHVKEFGWPPDIPFANFKEFKK